MLTMTDRKNRMRYSENYRVFSSERVKTDPATDSITLPRAGDRDWGGPRIECLADLVFRAALITVTRPMMGFGLKPWKRPIDGSSNLPGLQKTETRTCRPSSLTLFGTSGGAVGINHNPYQVTSIGWPCESNVDNFISHKANTFSR